MVDFAREGRVFSKAIGWRKLGRNMCLTRAGPFVGSTSELLIYLWKTLALLGDSSHHQPITSTSSHHSFHSNIFRIKHLTRSKFLVLAPGFVVLKHTWIPHTLGYHTHYTLHMYTLTHLHNYKPTPPIDQFTYEPTPGSTQGG